MDGWADVWMCGCISETAAWYAVVRTTMGRYNGLKTVNNSPQQTINNQQPINNQQTVTPPLPLPLSLSLRLPPPHLA